MKSYILLICVILFQLIGTSFLKKTEQFSKPVPTLSFIISMMASFYMLSHALKGIPIGIAYAIWSAFGIVLISLIGYFVYQQNLDLPAIIGIIFIMVGVVINNIFSKSTV